MNPCGWGDVWHEINAYVCVNTSIDSEGIYSMYEHSQSRSAVRRQFWRQSRRINGVVSATAL